MTDRKFDVFPLEKFDLKNLIGRSEREVSMFAQQALIPAGKVLDPVAVVMIRNKAEVIDGTKRVLACMWIQENIEDEAIKAQFATIPVQIFESVSVAERAIYSIVSNEHRSGNPLSAYLHMKDLIKKKKWIDYQKAYKLNPGTFKKLATLDELYKQQEFFDAFERGEVVMSTLFTVAKQDEPRQILCLAKLKENNSLTGEDVREVRQAAAEVILGGLDLDFTTPEKAVDHVKYVYMDDKFKINSTALSWTDAIAADLKGKIYRLFR